MKKQIISICLFTFITFVYAFDNQALTRETVNEHWKDIAFWEHGISSKLIEPGYNYGWESIDDDDLATAWVEGKKGDGIGEWVIIPIEGYYQSLDYKNGISDKKLSVNLSINNGFCKNERTFYNNNRVKKAKITIYEVPLIAYEDYRGTQALAEPSIMHETEIMLEDTMNQQIFTFNCSPKASFLEGSLYLYAQLTILDVYPGEKYQDTCISEMKANADVIKAYEKNKTSPKKVSEKKSNTIKNLIEKVANKSSEPKVSKKERIQLEQQKALIKEQEAKYVATKEDELYKTITQEELDDFNKDHYIKFYIGENEDYYWFWELYKSVARLCCKPLKNVGTTSPVLRGKLTNYHKEEMEVKMYGYVERGEDYELGPGPYVRAEVMKTLDPLWATSLYFDDHFFLENLEFVQDGKVLYTFTDKEIRNIQRADTFGLKNGGYR